MKKEEKPKIKGENAKNGSGETIKKDQTKKQKKKETKTEKRQGKLGNLQNINRKKRRKTQENKRTNPRVHENP